MLFFFKKKILMIINRTLLWRTGNILYNSFCIKLLNDDEHFYNGVKLSATVVGAYIHVGDFLFTSVAEDVVDRCVMTFRQVVESAGFIVKIKLCGHVDKFIGLVPVRWPPGFRPLPDRVVALAEALDFVAGQYILMREAVLRLLGIVIHYMQLWRPSMSIFS